MLDRRKPWWWTTIIPLVFQYPHNYYVAAQREDKVLVSEGLWVLQFRTAKITIPLVGHVTTGTGEA